MHTHRSNGNLKKLKSGRFRLVLLQLIAAQKRPSLRRTSVIAKHTSDTASSMTTLRPALSLSHQHDRYLSKWRQYSTANFLDTADSDFGNNISMATLDA
jgi:hypothetical protein